MNSRPPPCEGDALPAELLPHMGAATRRSVVCMPFMCRGQVFFAGGTSGGRGHGRRDGKSRTAAGPGASRRKGKRLPARGRGRRGQRAVPVARVVFPGALFCGCGPYPCRGARETAMPRQGLPAGNVRTGQSAGRPSRDRLPPAMRCKKIGRAAPVGLGYREKKRYRSPLVSL